MKFYRKHFLLILISVFNFLFFLKVSPMLDVWGGKSKEVVYNSIQADLNSGSATCAFWKLIKDRRTCFSHRIYAFIEMMEFLKERFDIANKCLEIKDKGNHAVANDGKIKAEVSLFSNILSSKEYEYVTNEEALIRHAFIEPFRIAVFKECTEHAKFFPLILYNGNVPLILSLSKLYAYKILEGIFITNKLFNWLECKTTEISGISDFWHQIKKIILNSPHHILALTDVLLFLRDTAMENDKCSYFTSFKIMSESQEWFKEVKNAFTITCLNAKQTEKELANKLLEEFCLNSATFNWFEGNSK